MHPIDGLERSIAQTRPIVAAVSTEEYDLPTPCVEWNVAALLNHIAAVLTLWRDLARDETDLSTLEGQHLGDDPARTFGTRADEALEAWRNGERAERPAQLGTELPGPFAVRMLSGDLLVHGWDLAKATGQDVAWDEDLAADILDWHEQAKKLFPPEMRARAFGPEVPVAADADAMTRLVALTGRHP